MFGIGLLDLGLILSLAIAIALIFGWRRALARGRVDGGRIAITLPILGVFILLAINGFELDEQWKWVGRIAAIAMLITGGILGMRAKSASKGDA